MLGTSVSESLSHRIGIPATVSGSRVLEAGGFAVIAFAATGAPVAGVVVASMGQFVYGLGFGAEGPIETSYRQGVTPARLQGRTSATARSFNRAAVVIGAPLGGFVADAVGLRPTLWLGSAGLLTGGVLLAVSGFRVASHDDQPPAE